MTTYEAFGHCDELGPEKLVHLHDPHTGMRAVVAVDNTARGPAIGGVRMAPDVTTQEVFRLARAMTLKNAAAGLAHGGGKSGILADSKTADKPRLMRAFARAISQLVDYIPGPDMGTDESCMGWIHDEIGRSVGLPRALGGIPLDEIGATGYGVVQCAEVAAEFCDLEIRGARVAVEGFGNVGRPAAQFLEDMGAKLVAASDSKGTVHDPGGIRADALAAAKDKKGSVTEYAKGEKLSAEALFSLPCDILIPAARPDSIHGGNAGEIQAKLILEGANIPTTAEAEAILHERDILVMPDFIANAGGVICAAVEYRGGTEGEVFKVIADKVRNNTREVLERRRAERIQPRRAAEEMARERVLQALSLRNAGR